MTNFKIGRWLLVALAIIGLAFAVPAVSAHGTDTTADDAPPYNGTPDDWATWMEAHMTEHMGPGSVEWMESHMGVTVDEMAQDMADEAGVTSERAVLEGLPEDAIHQYSTDNGIDLTVVGESEDSTLTEQLFDSTTEDVLESVTTSVLVARE